MGPSSAKVHIPVVRQTCIKLQMRICISTLNDSITSLRFCAEFRKMCCGVGVTPNWGENMLAAIMAGDLNTW